MRKKILIIVSDKDAASIQDFLKDFEVDIVYVDKLSAKKEMIFTYNMVVSLLVSDSQKVVDALKGVSLSFMKTPIVSNHSFLDSIASFASYFVEHSGSKAPLFLNVSYVGPLRSQSH